MELATLLLHFDVRFTGRILSILWVAAALLFLIPAVPLKAVDPIRAFYYNSFKRGKTLQVPETRRNGSGSLNLTVPQSFFAHFYLFGLAVNTILLVCAVGFATEGPWSRSSFDGDGSTKSVVGEMDMDSWRLLYIMLLFETHLVRRLYETIFVSKYNSAARMTAIVYILSLGYYLMVPLSLFSQFFSQQKLALAFDEFKQDRAELSGFFRNAPAIRDVLTHLSCTGWLSNIGAAITLYGCYHQYASHKILASLRANDRLGVSKTYSIPEGDWFEFVSNPHYLAEIVIYVGLAITSGGTSLTMYCIVFVVSANLYFTAKQTHDWYLTKFENYPKSRWAMIPFIC